MALLRKLAIVVMGVGLALLLTILLVEPRLTITIANIINDNPFGIRVALAVLLDVLILFVIFALVREPRASQRAAEGGLVVKAQGAVTDVSVPSVRDLVLKAIRDVPNVKSVEAQVASARGKADIELDVVVYGDNIILPDKQKEIDRALRQVVNKQLGLRMAGKPRVHIQLDERLDDEPTLLLGDTLAPTPTASQSSVIVTPTPSVEPSPALEQQGMYVRPRYDETTAADEVEAAPVDSTPVDVTPPVEPELVRDEPAPVEPLTDDALPPQPPTDTTLVSTQLDDDADEKPEDRTMI